MAAAATGRPERVAPAVGEVGRRRIGAGRDHLSIVEFVAADKAAGRSERAVGGKAGLPVSTGPATATSGRRLAKPLAAAAAVVDRPDTPSASSVGMP